MSEKVNLNAIAFERGRWVDFGDLDSFLLFLFLQPHFFSSFFKVF